MFQDARSFVVDWDQSYRRSGLVEGQRHFIKHLQTAVTIIAKLLDLWSQKYENGVGKNSGHFVAAEIVVARVTGNLVA